MAAGCGAAPAGDWASAEKTQSGRQAAMHAMQAARSGLIKVHLEDEKSWDKANRPPRSAEADW